MADYAAVAAKYARDVTSGKIPAGKYIKLACQRHLEDLDWQDDETFKYRFDVHAGSKACGFIELMPHVSGKWARQKMLLKLEPWQVFLVMNVFGWKRRSDNLRRYRRAFVLIPRKNGKSALAAAIGLYMLVADGEHGAQVYAGAKNEIQAKYVFTPARMMAMKSPSMTSHYGLTVNASNLHVLGTGSKFEPIIGNPGDGGSPSCALIDEYHEHPTDELYNTMETGMGAREQPLILVITTAGDNIAGPCYAMQDEIQSVLEGTRHDDETFGLLYTIDEGDDWEDFEVWKKVNPNYGVSVLEQSLKSDYNIAVSNPRKRGAKLTKHLNKWLQSKSAYYDVSKYMKAGDDTLKIDDFIDWECIIGVDLAEKRDLTAIELIFRRGAEYVCFGRYYAPEETIEQPENEHFRLWRDTGRLIQTDGAVTDQREILADLLDDVARFKVVEVAFDPWHSRQMSVELMENLVPCVEFGNRPSTMNEPMREMDALIADNKMIHNGCEAFSWMLSNVVNGTQSSDLHRPAKERAQNKIDGPVARMMALGRWMLIDEMPSSPWDDEEFVLEVG